MGLLEKFKYSHKSIRSRKGGDQDVNILWMAEEPEDYEVSRKAVATCVLGLTILG